MKNKLGQNVLVPCGQCIHCRLNHSRQWSIRITHEQLKYGDRSCFLTLTYDDEHLPADHSVHKHEVQLFLKRFRKQLGQKKIRYFLCGEYGERGKLYGLVNGRPHYHVIVFGVPVDADCFRNRHVHYEKGKPCGWHCDMDCWKNGKVHIGSVTPESANYVASYVLKKVKGSHAKEYYDSLGIEPEFVLMSRCPGIGSDYVESHSDYYKRNRFVAIKGVKYPLPRYYSEKVRPYRVSLDKMRDSLRRQGVSEDRIEHCLHMIKNGVDPLYTEEGAIQSEKNTKARLNIRSVS